MPLKLRRPLVLRVYGATVVLILAVGLAFAAIDFIAKSNVRPPDMQIQARYLANHLAASWFDESAFQRELEALAQFPGLEWTLFDEHGITRSQSLHASDSRMPLVKIPLTFGENTLGSAEFRFPPLRPPLFPLVLGLSVTLLAAAVSSLFLSRALVRPLKALSHAAEALGRGDLTVRVPVGASDEMGLLGDSFNRMAEALAQQLQNQTRLLLDVSHELRTPLARVRAAVELAQAKGQVGVEGIAEDLEELESLISDVLATARLDLSTQRLSGTPAPKLERVELGELLRHCVSRFEGLHPDHPLHAMLPAEPVALLADSVLLRRALNNLLDNAAKYSNAGSSVALQCRVDGHNVSIEVIDRGIGISAEDLARVGTPFFRTDLSRARKTGGVGLGLALARRIALAHGGSLLIRSIVDAGTTVTLTLPVT